MSWSRIRNALGRIAAPAAALALASCATAPTARTSGPALWELADSDTRIYLFGTIHMLPPGLQWRTPLIERAIASSDELVLEVAMGDDPMATARAMRKLGLSAGLPPLIERVPEEKRDALRKMIADGGIPIQALDRMESWAAALTLTAINFQRLGLDPEQGIEKKLTGDYGTASKPIRGLETAEEQFGFFDALPEEAQRKLLVAVLDDPAQARAQFAAMLAAWMKGDVDSIARTFNEDMALSAALRDKLLKQRNARWADWLAKRMDRPGTIFVAVGAGHLAGDDSLQHMLRAQGLKARRLQ
ncbi:TraB/GumN family protein [Sphingosinicella rhizophila]|uniref:TraB/GumN family protein n=1 Tax=Sphingosinicella rhizophila TaxID=3050082 RepID=A0ABU3Q4U9_9SPHN|nr:TraB/GumN family protein [Sphingosinicella sp. GR2756]MDT9598448.1 TraB/GumN family protein [Sphingosinicella sp. GR2756]